MITWIYLAKVMAAQGIFLAIYYFLLDRTALGSLKRFYLLAAPVGAFLIPMLPVYPTPEVVAESIDQMTYSILPDTKQPVISPASAADYGSSVLLVQVILCTVYLVGILWHAANLGRFLSGVRRRLKQGTRSRVDGIETVTLSGATAPHTFLRWIFIGGAPLPSAAVLAHEQAHARQLHSLDRLLIAILCAAWWWNPLLYVYGRAVAANHEFLADREVIRSGYAVPEYQRLIVEALQHNYTGLHLASLAGFSLTKKRFAMMTKKDLSLSNRLARYTTVCGFCIAAVALLGGRADAGNHLQSVGTAVSITLPTVDTILPPPPPTGKQGGRQVAVQPPTTADLAAWQDSHVYGIWIDGARIPNYELTNFAPADFAHYFSSELKANAQNYGAHDYQIDLYTRAKFQATFRASDSGQLELRQPTKFVPDGPRSSWNNNDIDRKLLIMAGGRPSGDGKGC